MLTCAGTSTSLRGYFKAKSQIANAPISAAGIQAIQGAFADQKGQGYWQAHAQGVSVLPCLTPLHVHACLHRSLSS